MPPSVTSLSVSPRIRVALVEDDEVLKELLVEQLKVGDEFELIGVTATLKDALTLVSRGPEVFLVDLGLPDGSGFELIRHIRAHAPDCKAVVISVFGDVRHVVQAIELGADGYLLKGSGLEQTASAIRTVMAGGAPLSPSVASHILGRLRAPGHAAPSKSAVSFTAREIAILESLAKGLTFKEVAAIHEISHHTVGDHVKAIYRKLSVNSRGEAVYEAAQSGLIRLSGP